MWYYHCHIFVGISITIRPNEVCSINVFWHVFEKALVSQYILFWNQWFLWHMFKLILVLMTLMVNSIFNYICTNCIKSNVPFLLTYVVKVTCSNEYFLVTIVLMIFVLITFVTFAFACHQDICSNDFCHDDNCPILFARVTFFYRIFAFNDIC